MLLIFHNFVVTNFYRAHQKILIYAHHVLSHGWDDTEGYKLDSWGPATHLYILRSQSPSMRSPHVVSKHEDLGIFGLLAVAQSLKRLFPDASDLTSEVPEGHFYCTVKQGADQISGGKKWILVLRGGVARNWQHF